MAFRFTCDLPLRWRDVDVAGVVNNAVYFTLLEQARFQYFDALGLLVGQQFPFLLGETSMRYHAPGRAGTTLGVSARVVRLGTKSLDMEYRVECAGELLATAQATLVWVDATLASCPIPPAARRQLAAFDGIAEQG